MNDRFKFRCGITISHYDDDGNDIETKVMFNTETLYDYGSVGVGIENLKSVVEKLHLSDKKLKTLWSYLYEHEVFEEGWFIFDNPDFIEQCIGLKDKNGKLIYEGDIVAKQFSNKPFSSKAKYKIKNCLVYWDKSGQFSIEYQSDDYRYYSASHDSFIGECEVIGNIHENLELMEA